MTQLDQLTADVSAQTTVTASAVTLLQTLTADLKAAGTDPVALGNIITNLETNTNALAAAVQANTPADLTSAAATQAGTNAPTPTPEPTPTPSLAGTQTTPSPVE